MRWGYVAGGGVAVLVAASASYLALRRPEPQAPERGGFVGSASCRSCHPGFYKLWAPSRHGLAMQPYTPGFAAAELTPHGEEVAIGGHRYRVETSRGEVVERSPQGETRYPIAHVLGGKNVYYFLTPLDRGRLQVLPLAYDVRRKAWYDAAASGVRHFPDRLDSPIHWKERPFTFNTSCYSCHVSQLTTNYDPGTDSYHTTWAEPGINCETCHGPAGEHVRLFQQARADKPPPDVAIIKTSEFSAEQINALCAPCHAKMIPLTADFRPGDRFFDHYDLVTLEHPDYYPDGRDLGENYTYTSWRMSPCAKAGQLDCQHCHTSSGRYRFDGDKADHACLPCHEDKVADPAAHSRHRAESAGSRCVSCHMPMTEFARMRRSDHSMLPPAPAASARFGSPNACNLCHTDQDAAWADRWVRRWSRRDYQAPVLRRASLLDAARKGDWSKLEEIAAYIASADRDEIYAASLIRLLRNAEREEKWPAILRALEDPSPLVRAGAADALATSAHPERTKALVRACRDESRLVRIRAAAALGPASGEMLNAGERAAVARAIAEFETSMRVRPDDVGSRMNLGNFYMSRGELERALAEFEIALKIDPRHVPALVNASLAYNMAGRNHQAEARLRAALEVEPANAAANFNLGLLLGEQGRNAEARQALARAWKSDPTLAAAAYNLCVLEAAGDVNAALSWCRRAAEARPQEPRYAYTLAFYLHRAGALAEAKGVLEKLVRRHPGYRDGYLLLAQIYQSLGNRAAAADMFQRAQRR